MKSINIKFFNLIVAIAITITSVCAQTEITDDTISGIWTLANSPYNVNNDFKIARGDTLIIEPGVTVNMKGHYSIEVYGCLFAQGTSSEMITFTPANTSEGWLGIGLGSGSGNSIMDYCIVEYGIANRSGFMSQMIGGGICIWSYEECEVTISNSIIRNCRAEYGGGIRVSSGNAIIKNNIITNNRAWTGAGVYCDGESNGDPVITGNIISNNTAINLDCMCGWTNNVGGGIYIDAGSSPVITNNTIINNSSAGGKGGAVAIYNNSMPVFYNNIIWGNVGSYGSQIYISSDRTQPEFYYNDIQGGLAAFGYATNVSFNGVYEDNIDDNPLVTSASAGAGDGYNGYTADWSLQNSSPCINIGKSTYAYVPTYDYLANTRIKGCNVDLGAIENTSVADYGHIILSYDLTEVGAEIGNNGAIDLSATNGLAPYAFTWSNSETTEDISGLTLGFYTVTAIDKNSCTTKERIKLNYDNVMDACGFIETNTTWDIDTVKVYCDIIVEKEATLTIAPGTYVEFQGASGISVFGALNAEGTENERITFTINDTTGYSDNTMVGWTGIRFLYNKDANSIIDYSEITYASSIGTSESVEKYGGAIGIQYSDNITISNSIIKYNYASISGGGIYSNAATGIVIIKNDISNNVCGNDDGGGIALTYSDATVKNNTISYNHGSNGGGISMEYSSDPEIVNNKICNNTVGKSGAGIYVKYSSCDPLIVSNLISNNYAGYNGGGIAFNGGDTSIIVNNTITNNVASDYNNLYGGIGGGIVLENTVMAFRNNILFGNISELSRGHQVAVSGDASALEISYCNIEYGIDSLYENSITYTGVYLNNIDKDPLFTAPTAGLGADYNGVAADWSLQDFSPCINAGDTSVLAVEDFDLAGNTRVFEDSIDIGAFEYQIAKNCQAAFIAAPCDCTPVHYAFSDDSGIEVSSWEWSFGDGAISKEQSPIHEYDTSGTYIVSLTIVTSAWGCVSTHTDTLEMEGLDYPWTLIPGSDENHTIVIPADMDVYLDGDSLEVGDFIGFFYRDALDSLQCSGLTVWNETNTTVSVWGDSVSLKNGFADGENFNIKVWKNDTETEFDIADAIYDNLSFTATGSFVADGLSKLLSISTEIPVVPSQKIALYKGWNLISSYINPISTKMSDIFADLGNVVVKNSAGTIVYAPGFGITGGVWNIQQGYKVHISQNDTLVMSGTKIDPATSIPLPKNSSPNFLPYYGSNEVAIVTALDSIVTDISFAQSMEYRNGAANVWAYNYIPEHIIQPAIDQVGNMKPGLAYKIKMINEVTSFVYPDLVSNKKSRKSKSNVSDLQHFSSPTTTTGENSILIIPNDFFSTALQIGDEIAVFAPGGVIAGALVYNGEHPAVTVWENDSMYDGTSFEIRLWRKVEDKETGIQLTFESGNGLFDSNTLQVAKTVAEVELGIGESLFDNAVMSYPNPANDIVNFRFTLQESGNVRLNIYNIMGQNVSEEINRNYSQGEHVYNFDVNNLDKGQYIYVLEINDKIYRNKITVIK